MGAPHTIRPPATIYPHPAVSEPQTPQRAPFTIPAPLRVYQRLVDHARARLAESGTALHVDEAAADYLLHEERDGAEETARRGRPYWSERWGWSGWKVRTEIAAVRAEVEAWRSSFGRHAAASPPPARRQPAASETPETSDTEAFPPARRQPAASPPPAELSLIRARDQDSKTPRLDDDEGGDTRARAPLPAEWDELPPNVLRYRSQIEALLAASPEARRGAACRALRAGQMPPGDLHRELETAEAEHGLLAFIAALTVTANEAAAAFYPQRLNHFRATLASICDHAQRTRIGTDEPATGAGSVPRSHAGSEGGAGAAVGTARRQKGGGGAARRGGGGGNGALSPAVRGTSAQRASSVNVRDLLAGLHEHRARRQAGPNADEGAGAGDDGGDAGGV